MRYVMFMIPAVYGTDAADETPSPEAVDAMVRYNADLAEAGVLEALDGLHPPNLGVHLTFGPDGPAVAEMASEGAVGGFWILSVESHEAAVNLARRCPAAPGDVLELRRIQDLEDFPPDVQEVLARFDR